MSPPPFFDEVDGHVDRDGMHPSVEAGLSPEAFDGAIRLREDLLKQVIGVFMVRGHIVNEAVEPGTIAEDQVVEGLGIPGLCAGNQLIVVWFRSFAHSEKPARLPENAARGQ
jgi:hypothetical protein